MSSGKFDNHFLRDTQEAVRGRAERARTFAAMTNADGLPATEQIATPDDLVPGRALDREKRELVVPDFPGHPCPEAAQFLWIMARETGTVPPWRVRVHALLFGKYNGIRPIAQALAPHAVVIMTPDGLRPLPPLDGTKAIEFNWHDQLAAGPPPAHNGGALILPSGVERSSRTA